MTTKEICELFGISRTALMNYRNGYTSYREQRGKVYEHYAPALLIDGKDWKWIKGKIVYNKSAVKKIMRFREKRL